MYHYSTGFDAAGLCPVATKVHTESSYHFTMRYQDLFQPRSVEIFPVICVKNFTTEKQRHGMLYIKGLLDLFCN